VLVTPAQRVLRQVLPEPRMVELERQMVPALPVRLGQPPTVDLHSGLVQPAAPVRLGLLGWALLHRAPVRRNNRPTARWPR